jgi:hypothetical protein
VCVCVCVCVGGVYERVWLCAIVYVRMWVNVCVCVCVYVCMRALVCVRVYVCGGGDSRYIYGNVGSEHLNIPQVLYTIQFIHTFFYTHT